MTWWEARIRRVATWLTARRRRQILSVGAIATLVTSVVRKRLIGTTVSLAMRASVVVPCLLLLITLCYLTAAHFDRLPRTVRRRPQMALHAGFWTLLVLLWTAPLGEGSIRATLTLVVVLLPFLLWRLGYLLKSGQRGKAAGSAFSDHLFYLWPVWGGSETPYGKGLDYLARHEAQSSKTLARSQLAGVKLLVLAGLWSAAQQAMSGLVYGDGPIAAALPGWNLGVPRLNRAIGAAAVPLPLAWVSVYCDLVWNTLKIAVKGHVYIGVLRLLGFHVLRNTDRPLLAESVVEFWNRYYYYFKELLVEFFFYPTYARWRTRPWLRTLLAVFAAAFAGNLYYHLLEEEALLLGGDGGAVWTAFGARTLYSFLLASGIYVSMLREQRRRGAPTAAAGGALRRLVRIAGVWTFFGLIHVWGLGRQSPTFDQRVGFFLSLFALR